MRHTCIAMASLGRNCCDNGYEAPSLKSSVTKVILLIGDSAWAVGGAVPDIRVQPHAEYAAVEDDGVNFEFTGAGQVAPPLSR